VRWLHRGGPFGLLGARLVYLQIYKHEELSTQAENNRITVVPIVPNRGLILDRNGKVLAENRPAFQLELVRERVPDVDATLAGLAKIGVRITIEKIPGANWRTTLNKKELPMVLNRFSGWLDYPEYYFFWNLHGNNSIFNISAYRNEAMDRLIDRARFTDDPAEYEKSVKDFVALCMQEVPIIPLNQPIHDVAMQKAVGGYEFWFHREPDFRQFQKG